MKSFFLFAVVLFLLLHLNNHDNSLQTKEFMLKNSEDANSLAVLLNTLCKLSINYINDVCPDVQSSFDKALQEHHCFPPAR